MGEMDSSVLLIGAAILTAWIMLTLLSKERERRVDEQKLNKPTEPAAPKPALPEPTKVTTAPAKKAA